MICQKCGATLNEGAAFCSRCGNKIELPIKKPSPKAELLHDISAVWPEWQVESELGKGSYGVVYKAVRRDNNIEISSAIKVISIPSNASEVNSLRMEGYDESSTRDYFKSVVDEFVCEVQLMESLRGVQNIVSVEDYKVIEKTDEIGWTIYIRMELLTPFNDFIRDIVLTEEEVIKIGVDICSALEICQQSNIIHRDIKLENIFVNNFGFFKLGDFGIARRLENATGGLSQKGTFNYMAPEVARGTRYDARVDIYSLGIVLYRLLNRNRLPFLDTDKQFYSPRDRAMAVERRLSGEMLPPPCDASAAMADIILRACAFDQNKRFATPTDMKKALTKVLYGEYVIPTVAVSGDTTLVDDVDKTVSVNGATINTNSTVRVANQGVPETNGKSVVPSQKAESLSPTVKKIDRKGVWKYIILGIVAVLLIVILALVLKSCSGGEDSDDIRGSVTTTTRGVATTTKQGGLVSYPSVDSTTDTTTATNATTIGSTMADSSKTTKTTIDTTTTDKNEATKQTSTEKTDKSTTTTKATTTTTKKPTTTVTDNRGKIVNGVFTNTDGRFQLSTPNWKTMEIGGGSRIVPSNYVSGNENTILITSSPYVNGWSESLFKGTLESLNSVLVGDISTMVINGVTCYIAKVNNSSGVTEYIYSFQTTRTDKIDASLYFIRFMQAPGRADMGSISETIMSTLKLL